MFTEKAAVKQLMYKFWGVSFLVLVLVFGAQAVGEESQNFGRSVITQVNRARGEIVLRNGSVVRLMPDTAIYGQEERYPRNILRVNLAVQVFGVQENNIIRATRINVHASSLFWSELNRH